MEIKDWNNLILNVVGCLAFLVCTLIILDGILY